MIFYAFDVISFLKKLVKNDTEVVCRRGSWVVLTKGSGNL